MEYENEQSRLPGWVGVILATEGSWGAPWDVWTRPGVPWWMARRNWFLPRYRKWLAKQMKAEHGH